MLYKGKLPELHELAKVAESVESYPISPKELVATAEKLGFGENVIDFIYLFGSKQHVAFESRADFYVRAAELALLIYEERHQPKEGWLGPLE